MGAVCSCCAIECEAALVACACVIMLQAAGGPGGQAATEYQLQLQQEQAELRQQALSAQRRLYECQQQLSKAQVGVRMHVCVLRAPVVASYTCGVCVWVSCLFVWLRLVVCMLVFVFVCQVLCVSWTMSSRTQTS